MERGNRETRLEKRNRNRFLWEFMMRDEGDERAVEIEKILNQIPFVPTLKSSFDRTLKF